MSEKLYIILLDDYNNKFEECVLIQKPNSYFKLKTEIKNNMKCLPEFFNLFYLSPENNEIKIESNKEYSMVKDILFIRQKESKYLKKSIFQSNYDNLSESRKENIDEKYSCFICLNHIKNEKPYFCYICQRIFHRDCLEDWDKKKEELNENLNCPNCRNELPLDKWRQKLDFEDNRKNDVCTMEEMKNLLLKSNLYNNLNKIKDQKIKELKNINENNNKNLEKIMNKINEIYILINSDINDYNLSVNCDEIIQKLEKIENFIKNKRNNEMNFKNSNINNIKQLRAEKENKNNINLNHSNNLNYILLNNNSSTLIDDFMVLKKKYNEILKVFGNEKLFYNECFEFWNYFFNCSLYENLEKFFTSNNNFNDIEKSIKYLLLSILICYDCCFDIDILNIIQKNPHSLLDDILNLNNKNIILINENFVSKIDKDKIVISNFPFEKLEYNTSLLIDFLTQFLDKYKIPRRKCLTSLFKRIIDKSYEDINDFYEEYILRVDHIESSILGSVFIRENNNLPLNPEDPPYIHTISPKKYSLILDLDETLANLNYDINNQKEAKLRLRPDLGEFLIEVEKYYEIIIFNEGDDIYNEIVIDAFKENKINFGFIFSRQHMIIKDNKFVKDLTRIGRPLDKIIIIDNMPQNFRLQKENGICIKSFWGEDSLDNTLNILKNILINIAKDGGDLRKGLVKYRKEIIEKVYCGSVIDV